LKEKGVDDLKDDKASQTGWINLLPLIDPQKDAVAGTWTIRNGELVSDRLSGSRIEVPFEPPEEYDFRVIFSRMEGNFHVAQILSCFGTMFSFEIGAYANTTIGFTNVSGAGVDKNSSTIKLASCLDNNRKYISVVQVRKDGLKAFLDGKLITQLNTDYSNMSLNRAWALRSKSILGVGSTISLYVFHNIELLEITGKGKFTRGEPKAQSSNTQGNESTVGLDPIVGEWKWMNGITVVFSADGSAQARDLKGTWKLLNKELRQYEIAWATGGTDTVSLDGAMTRLSGTSHVGKPVSGIRIGNNQTYMPIDTDTSIDLITGKWTWEGASGEPLSAVFHKNKLAELIINDKASRQGKLSIENGVIVVAWTSQLGGVVFQSIRVNGNSANVETIRLQGNTSDKTGRKFTAKKIE
jgi:hypothetical protein